MGTKITEQSWDKIGGEEVKKFTLKNDVNQEVDVISYGATVTAVRTPDKSGKIEDVVCGFDNLEGYLSDVNPYFGATVGRVANRIGNGKFTLDTKVYQISQNHGKHTLHGGFKGWNAKIWKSTIKNDTVVMSLVSQDRDEGFPGTVEAEVTFQLTNSGELIITMKAKSDKATPINLTNHSYFNLAGHGTNAAEIYKHKISINSKEWTVTDSDSIPTGEIRQSQNSIMDLRKPTVLGDVINKVPGGGYDYNFCLLDEFAAKVTHATSGRTLEVHTNQPGVQFYTANFFPETGGIPGKSGQKYLKHGAFCLETQNYPDAVNHDNFPNSIVRPGQEYNHIVKYKFGLESQ